MKRCAFFRQVMQARMSGSMVPEAHVVFGYRWHPVDEVLAPRGAHMLALRPEDYAPWRYEWSAVAGLKVTVVDRSQGPWGGEQEPVLWLCAEIARVAAPVDLYDGGDRIDIATLACCLREGKQPRWPTWWSDELEVDYRRRSWDWYERYYGLFT